MTPGSETIEAICADIIATAAKPLAQSETLPRAAYLSEGYFAHEAEHVLSAAWMCVAHVSQLPQIGSYLALDLLNEPLVVVRGNDNVVRVLSRVCPHRAADILHSCFETPEQAVTSRFLCPYHAWAFSLEGKKLASMHMETAEGFDDRDWNLSEIRTEIWHGFVFVNLDGKASPLAEQYARFGRSIAPWNTAEMEVAISLEWECDFNWKVMVENWIESYHHMGAHVQTLQVTMPARSTWAEPEQPSFIHCHLPFRPANAAEIRDAVAEGKPMPGFTPIVGLPVDRQVEWGLYLGHPCFMFLTMRDRVLCYRLQPISAQRCKLLTMTLVSKEAKLAPDYEATLIAETKMLADFHLEDMAVNTAVQAGLRSRHAVRGRLSHLEEPVWMIQRFIASRLQSTLSRQAAE